MTPRTELVALPVEATLSEVLGVVQESGLSRYPVYDESIDNIIGVVLAKDLLKLLAPRANTEAFDLPSIMRPVHVIPGSREVEEVLADFKRLKEHMAVVLDEYGGTAGIVTMEDLVEEVVGDIADEYDFASRESIVTDGVLELAGSLSLIDVRSDYRIQIPEGDWTTLGGYAFAKLGRLPRMGDRIPIPGGEMEVVAMDGRRIAALRIHRAGIRQPAVAQHA
jgi:CBS domain containing-hemolysin-like protein